MTYSCCALFLADFQMGVNGWHKDHKQKYLVLNRHVHKKYCAEMQFKMHDF